LRITSLFAAFIAFIVLASSAGANTALRLELAGIVEAPGKMTVTVATAGADGRPMPGLTAENFKATFGEKPLVLKEVAPAGSTGIAASVIVMADASKTMTPPALVQVKAALPEFVNGLDAGDKVGVVAFNTNVTNLIDVTPERGLVVQAINRLGGAGDSDVFGAVSDASRRITTLTPERRMVVLISAGRPVASVDKRAASLAAAKAAGVIFYPVAVGEEADRDYLAELALVTGGRMMDAPNANALRPVLSDLAAAIKGQYALVMDVPVAADRTQAGRLDITLNSRGETALVQRMLTPLQGAVAPTFTMKVNGLTSGQKITGPVTIEPNLAADTKLSKIEYGVDNNPPYAITEPPFAIPVDPAKLSQGNHILKIVATDTTGRRAEVQVPFAAAPPPAPGKGLPIVPIFSLLALAAIGYLGFKVVQRRQLKVDYAARTRPYSTRSAPPVRVARPIEAAEAEDALPTDDRLQGRLLVMDERPEMRGQAGSIREYELRGSPLSFGVGSSCAVRVEDTSGEIANEEARIWVQKRRLVYHKLTTLSAMATEGMVSGWLFLDDGDEMRVGNYRLMFRADEEEAAPELDEGAIAEAARNFGTNMGQPAA
jgi:hypothetical protein